MSDIMLISDAAKEVNVENHVLRYWEEELHLPIKRNELGHRYYTQEDVERFKQIKSMKERGLQLKAIKMILKNGKLDVISPTEEDREEFEDKEPDCREEMTTERIPGMAIDIVGSKHLSTEMVQEKPEDKSRRLQWLLQQLIRDTLLENNRELCREMKESIMKEMDYQFRVQEERDEERERRQVQRGEEYYQKMDELLRKKSKKVWRDSQVSADASDILKEDKKTKKKRHSIF